MRVVARARAAARGAGAAVRRAARRLFRGARDRLSRAASQARDRGAGDRARGRRGRPARRGGMLGPLRRRDRAIVDEAIARVGLTASARIVRCTTLSGGQQQRAFIAKALAAEPTLLVLDEPTTGVDVEAQETLAGLLAQLHSELGSTILYVSHEFGAVEHARRAARARPRRDRLRRRRRRLPGVWHDPSHAPCLTSSSCGSRSRPAPWSACSRRRSASSSSSGA